MDTKKDLKKGIAEGFLSARRSSLINQQDIRFRMESMGTIKGVEFINDSKATDIHSTLFSLEQLQKPVTLILGTSEFPENYSLLKKQIRYKVVNLIVFGRNDELISESFKGLVDHYSLHSTAEEAFDEALNRSSEGYAVLFSPSCTSFEMFDDYQHRGQCFSEWFKAHVE